MTGWRTVALAGAFWQRVPLVPVATPLVTSVMASVLMLAGCDDATQPAPVTSAAAATAPAAPVEPAPLRPAAIPATDTTDAAAPAGTLPNDPSAPVNTPLCGFAAQESNALSRQLLSRHYAEAGQCSAYACFDAATATYIGADGYRHVCR